MKPNFALSLSFEGIKLLHRAAGGWREVGEVAVTADDLAGELAMLRKTAAGLAPVGVRSKLIIPSSQIKYLTIDTMGLSDAACRKAAEAALEGATPYPVSELVYDISMDGPTTHVAAVARETLAEAEAFATEHRFHPVSFVAVPGDAPYLGEPFFGPTAGAAKLLEPGETVEPDGIAVVIVGPATPAAAPAPASGPAPEPIAAPAPKSVAKPEADAAKPQDAEPHTAPAPAAASQAAQDTANSQIAPELPLEDPAPATRRAPESAPPAAEAATPDETQFVAPKPPEAKPQAKPEPQPVAAATSTPPSSGPAVVPAAAPSIAPRDRAADAPMAGPGPTPEPGPILADTTFADVTVDDAISADAISPDAFSEDTGKPDAPSSGFASRRAVPVPAAKPLGGAARAAPAPDSSSLSKPQIAADTATAPAAATAPRVGFFSRRKPRTGAAAPLQAPAAQIAAAGTEAERMTVFGARADQVGGKPRFLGLIMTVILLVFLAGVAAWAAVFLDDGIAGIIKREPDRPTASAPENQIAPQIIRTPDGVDPAQADRPPSVQAAALDPVLSAEDTAVLDAMQTPRAEPARPVISEAEAAARYAVTGIWPLAPDTPLDAVTLPSVPVYHSGIDAVSTAQDAIALPVPQPLDAQVQVAAAISPPPYGQATQTDENGWIVPTAEGVVTPAGFTIYAAPPPLKPPATPARVVAPQATAPSPEARPELQVYRPQDRPEGFAEQFERSELGGVTLGELAVYRPTLRPRSVQERAREAEEQAQAQAEEEARAAEPTAEPTEELNREARAAAAAQAASAAAAAALAIPKPTILAVPTPALEGATQFATPASLRPDTRPRNFARIVQRAEREAPVQEETRVAAAASVAPRAVTPSLPSTASVSRNATVRNAINLRRVNLIGVFGKPASRRALIRLPNGRYQKVSVGDRIDGGRVSAISESQLLYTKGGRNLVLEMP